jgi:hypothetical protein
MAGRRFGQLRFKLSYCSRSVRLCRVRLLHWSREGPRDLLMRLRFFALRANIETWPLSIFRCWREGC